MTAGSLVERVAFDAPILVADGLGGSVQSWVERFARAAEVRYQRGDEAVQAARLAGRSIYKVKVRSDSGTRTITTDWRMRDLRRGGQGGLFPGLVYNIREVDAVSDRAWVWIVVEGT